MFASKFAGAAFAAAAAITISFEVIVAHGEERIPIAMIAHYTDDECSILDTRSDFTGYYRDPNAEPGTAEANYTYFCNPEMLPSYAATYGMNSLDSCYVDNGGNWYFQPLGFCGNFVMNNKPMSVKFTSIDYETRNTVHTVYSDLKCAVPKVTDAKFSGDCFANNQLAGKNGTAKVEAFFSSIGSYQIIVPDAYNIIPTSSSSGRNLSVFISSTIISGFAFLF